MKKIYFTLGLGVLFLGANAQQTLKIKNPLKKGTVAHLAAKGVHHKIKTTPQSNSTNAKIAQQHSSVESAPIWSDDFSNASTWTMSHGAGTSADWSIGTTPGQGTYNIGTINSTTSANGFALFDSDNDCSGNQIAHLTTATPINLTGHSQVRLKFQQLYRRDADSSRIYISTDGTTWTNFPINEQYAVDGLSSNPEIVTVDISSVAGNQATVWVRFTYYSPTSASSWGSYYGPDNGCGYNWLVDDVSIEDVPAHDLISLAALGYTECGLPAAGVLLEVTNNGANAESNFPVVYTVNGGAAVTETYTGSVAPGDTVFYQFNTLITGVTSNTSYNLNVYTALSTDVDNTNDTAHTSFAGTPYSITYTTSYEDSPATDMSGWAYEDADGDGYDWQIGGVSTPRTGSNAALLIDYSSNDIGAPSDNWLFSPCLSVTAGNIYQVKYYKKLVDESSSGLATAANIGLFYGDSSAASHMTATIAPTHSLAVGASYGGAVTASFTATTTGNIVIGIEVTGSTTNDTAITVLFIDDFSVTQTGSMGIKTIVNSADLSIYPNPTNGVLNITTTAPKATVEIYNVMGQVVMTKEIANGTTSLDINNLSNGVYSVQVTQNNTVSTSKIIKTN